MWRTHCLHRKLLIVRSEHHDFQLQHRKYPTFSLIFLTVWTGFPLCLLRQDVEQLLVHATGH